MNEINVKRRRLFKFISRLELTGYRILSFFLLVKEKKVNFLGEAFFIGLSVERNGRYIGSARVLLLYTTSRHTSYTYLCWLQEIHHSHNAQTIFISFPRQPSSCNRVSLIVSSADYNSFKNLLAGNWNTTKQNQKLCFYNKQYIP